MSNATAQGLCTELFSEIEGAMSDAWISDEAGTDDPVEYLRFVRGHLAALEEARTAIKQFLRRHRRVTSHMCHKE